MRSRITHEFSFFLCGFPEGILSFRISEDALVAHCEAVRVFAREGGSMRGRSQLASSQGFS
jgi:hypothetical protein